MHPAFSVIAFTSLSGAGYGLLFWLGILVAAGQAERNPTLVLTALAIAAVLVAAGLLASVAHLGRPERAWRAFSQWRSSWLSREGIVAVLSFAPMFALAYATWHGGLPGLQRGAALSGCVLAVLTVFCTARIYDTLKPIPAWRQPWVLPNYLLLAAASGAVWLWSVGVIGFALPGHRGDVLILLGLLLLAALGKSRYWRLLATAPAPVEAAAALALPPGSRVRVFEAPHTEANFLLKEMGFALARKHARRLQGIALLLLAGIPVLVLLPAQVWPVLRVPAAVIVLPSVMLAVLVERWLFFAQARHVVLTYYQPESAPVRQGGPGELLSNNQKS